MLNDILKQPLKAMKGFLFLGNYGSNNANL